MLGLVGEAKMVATMDSSKKSMLKLSALSEKQRKQGGAPPLPSAPTIASCRLAYEKHLRLPELQRLWSSTEFPEWKGESVIKPALQSLEITFRFISTVLSDTRHYSNCREWQRRLESLAKDQISVISLLCDDYEGHMGAPTVVCSGEKVAVSEESLLPRLASWHKSEAMAQRILQSVETEMSRCRFTLGLGEANPRGKPSLCYDDVCKPAEVHYLKRNQRKHHEGERRRFGNNMEKETVHTTMQLVETWMQAEKKVLERVRRRIEEREEERACDDCWLVEKMWKVLGRMEEMHLVMDPEDLMRMGVEVEEEVWYRSEGLREITRMSKEMMKEKVPWILEVEVDPKGGPGIVEAAMKVYKEKREEEKIHLLQAMQGVEGAVKGFYFGLREVVRSVMGSAQVSCCVFMDPTSYFPSLDAAKTFLSHYYWEEDNHHHHHAAMLHTPTLFEEM